MKFLTFVIFVLIFNALIGQNKNLDGTYVSTFTANYDIHDNNISSTTIIHFTEGSRYESYGKDNYCPQKCYGTYHINDSIIGFNAACEILDEHNEY